MFLWFKMPSICEFFFFLSCNNFIFWNLIWKLIDFLLPPNKVIDIKFPKVIIRFNFLLNVTEVEKTRLKIFIFYDFSKKCRGTKKKNETGKVSGVANKNFFNSFRRRFPQKKKRKIRPPTLLETRGKRIFFNFIFSPQTKFAK